MSATKLLGQLLGSGQSSAQPGQGRENDLMRLIERKLGAGGLQAMLGSGQGGPPSSPNSIPGGQAPGGFTTGGLGSILTGAPGKAAIAGGVLGLLMKGGKKPKKMLGSAAKIGGLGLVAGLAWRAYQQHQSGGPNGTEAFVQPLQLPSQQQALPDPAAYMAPEGSAFLPAEEAGKQAHARAILIAMIAAAKADGHVDDAERERLHEAVDTLALAAEDKAFLFDQLRAPLDMEAVVREATTPELAAELYVASLFMADETDATEREYLNRLASALNLEPAFARRIEEEVHTFVA